MNLETSKDHEKRWMLKNLDPTENHFIIRKNEILVGRSETCDLIINSNYVSTIHAVLTFHEKNFKVIDLGSTNGTYLNGEKIKESSLNPGDSVRFGQMEYKLEERESENTQVINLGDLEDKTRVIDLNKLRKDHDSESTGSKEVSLPKFDQLPEESEETGEFSDLELTKLVNIKHVFDQSEYIFEDPRFIRPILEKPDIEESLEVMVLMEDVIMGIYYLPIKDSRYYAVGADYDEEDEVVIDSLGVEDEHEFINITGEKVVIQTLGEHEGHYIRLGRRHRIKKEHSSLEIQAGDIVQFTKKNIKVFLRRVDSPQSLKQPSFWQMDRVMLFFILPLFGLLSYSFIYLQGIEIDRDRLKKNAPKKIEKILYRPKPRPDKIKIEQEVTSTKKDDIQNEKELSTEVTDNKERSKKKKVENKSGNEKIKNKNIKKKILGKSKKNKKLYKNKRTAPNTTAQFDFSKSIKTLKVNSGKFSDITKVPQFNEDIQIANSNVDVKGNVKLAKVSGKSKELKIKNQGNVDMSFGLDGVDIKKDFKLSKFTQKTVVLGIIDPDLIREILAKHIPQFRHCYDQELERHSGQVKGTVDMRFFISSKGRVYKVKLRSKRFRFTGEGKKCITSVLKGIRFPKPKGGGVVEIRQPLNFETLK